MLVWYVYEGSVFYEYAWYDIICMYQDPQIQMIRITRKEHKSGGGMGFKYVACSDRETTTFLFSDCMFET